MSTRKQSLNNTPIDYDKLTPTEASAANEHIKWNSNYLRGDLAKELIDFSTAAVADDSTQLTKFHGTYMQDDRDVRAERRKKKLDKAYSFMIRIRVPGGVCTPEQWLKMDYLADTYANGSLKLTTRQAFQVHGVIKFNLKETFKEINEVAMDCVAACGDVNRNVMCNPNPYLSTAHADVLKLSQDISDQFTPQTGAYHETWLDGEKQVSTEEEEEPVYSKQYLPRKFKTVVAVPPSNDVDIYAHCLGFIAIVEDDKVVGYNVTVGGGMGMTHGDKETFPRTADVMCFVEPEDTLKVAEAVITTQRDFGNRHERKNARVKYTVERMGIDAFRAEVENRVGKKLEDPRPFKFDDTGDRFGWNEGVDGKHHCTLYITNGRLKGKQKDGLREIAKIHDGDFRLTANQNVMIAQISDEKKPEIETLLKEYDLNTFETESATMKGSMACVSLPTCGLGLAESERYLPSLIGEYEKVLDEAGIADEEIKIRMTGCPNGCARPYLAEVGFVGKGPDKYNLYLGAAFDGSRLNKLYREDVSGMESVEILKPIILQYAKEREDGEHFGDFVVRTGIIAETTAGNNFHENVAC